MAGRCVRPRGALRAASRRSPNQQEVEIGLGPRGAERTPTRVRPERNAGRRDRPRERRARGNTSDVESSPVNVERCRSGPRGKGANLGPFRPRRGTANGRTVS